MRTPKVAIQDAEIAQAVAKLLVDIKIEVARVSRDIAVIKRLMDNLIVLTNAGAIDGFQATDAMKVSNDANGISAICETIANLVRKLISTTETDITELRKLVKDMFKQCREVLAQLDHMDGLVETMPEDENHSLRAHVLRARMYTIRKRLDEVMGMVDELGYRASLGHEQSAESEDSVASQPSAELISTAQSTLDLLAGNNDLQKHTDASELPDMALRTLMTAKVTCANTIHELDTIDCFTDDWDTRPERKLVEPAMDIHLHCQYAAEESKALVDIVDGILTNPASGSQIGIFTEMEVRRENAVNEVKLLLLVLDETGKAEQDPMLGLREMQKRAGRLLGKLHGLKKQVDELESMVITPQPQQNQVEGAAR